MPKLKKGDRVLANFIGGLEEGKIIGKSKIGGRDIFDVQSLKRPKDKLSASRRDIRDVRTGM